jgi:hypothetical protein
LCKFAIETESLSPRSAPLSQTSSDCAANLILFRYLKEVAMGSFAAIDWQTIEWRVAECGFNASIS